MAIERRALYNSLKLNWLRDPSAKVESWQVEDLRTFPDDALFWRLKTLNWPLTKEHFLTLAEGYHSPEEMVEDLLGASEINPELQNQVTYDQVYLTLFELWRRLMPEKQTLSIFCDELDHQIYLYDQQGGKDSEVKVSQALSDVISELLEVLNENADAGISPQACMESILAHSAHDVEEFLYDYITDQIEMRNFTYAHDLIEGFYPYISDIKWFDFLNVQMQVVLGEVETHTAFQTIMKKAKTPTLDFYFEILAFLTQYGDQTTFAFFVKKSLPMLETEMDLTDLVSLIADFYHYLDDDFKEKEVLGLLKGRDGHLPEKELDARDPMLTAVKKLFAEKK